MSNAMESIEENIEPIRAPNGLYNLAEVRVGGDDITAAAAEVLDDIASLTVSAEGSSLSGIREVQTTLPIRKPKKDEFFRSHATAFRGPYSVYELKAQMSTETYFVTPKIWEMFKDDLLKGHGKVVVLRLSMARGGLLFLHPITPPDPLSRANEYNESARECAQAAVNNWVRMQADTTQGRYRMWIAEGDLGDPKWPEFDLDEMVNRAFKGRIVASADHALLEALRGRE